MLARVKLGVHDNIIVNTRRSGTSTFSKCSRRNMVVTAHKFFDSMNEWGIETRKKRCFQTLSKLQRHRQLFTPGNCKPAPKSVPNKTNKTKAAID